MAASAWCGNGFVSDRPILIIPPGILLKDITGVATLADLCGDLADYLVDKVAEIKP